MVIVDIWGDVLEKSGLVGVLILAGWLALLIGSLLWLLASIVRAGGRWLRRWQIRRELRVLRGGRTLFTSYGDLVERPAKPAVRSLRHRGDNDAA